VQRSKILKVFFGKVQEIVTLALDQEQAISYPDGLSLDSSGV
jgi:hypothetical protein